MQARRDRGNFVSFVFMLGHPDVRPLKTSGLGTEELGGKTGEGQSCGDQHSWIGALLPELFPLNMVKALFTDVHNHSHHREKTVQNRQRN